MIGATTFDEYRKHIERDAALERRFQPIMVDEPTEEEVGLFYLFFIIFFSLRGREFERADI